MSLTMWPRTRAEPRRRHHTAVVVAVLAAAALLASCAGTGYHYVKSSEDHTYFKVPDSWKLYDQQELLDDVGLTDDQKQEQLDTTWAAAFDGDPHPSIRHVTGKAKSTFPIGLARVFPIDEVKGDQVSLSSLRDLFVDVNSALEAKTAQLVKYEPVNLDGGFHGSHMVVRITQKNSTVILNQVAVLNQASSKVYALFVFCESQCYAKQESKIEKIVDSWTVKDN